MDSNNEKDIYEKTLEVFHGDDLATDVFIKKYSYEQNETPHDMWMRVAKEFTRIENKYKKLLSDSSFSKLSDYGKKRLNIVDFDHIHNLLYDFKYIIPGGSLMAGAGTKSPTSLSNCFVISPADDNIESIFNNARDQSQIFKRRGGCIEENSEIIVLGKGNIPIKDCEIGDMVLSFNIETGEDEWKPIKDKYYTEVDIEDQVELVYSNSYKPKCCLLKTSKKHPLLTLNGDGYVYKSVNDGLTVGEYGRSPNLIEWDIRLSEIISDNETKYNYIDIEVENNNNYYAGTEYGFVNIHNCGHDLSNLRPKGAKVNNSSNLSDGIISWMSLYSESTSIISQAGRRGALLLSIDCNHPDLLDFIQSKEDHSKITGANISVKFTEDFMEAVENDEDYFLKFPVNATLINEEDLKRNSEYNVLNVQLNDFLKPVLYKKVKAKEIWNKFVETNHKDAEPGAFFWSSIINRDGSSVYDEFKPVTTNPCGELPLAPFQSCILIHTNLYSLVDDPFTENAKINYERAYKVFYENMCLADDMVDLEIEAVEVILEKIDPRWKDKYYDGINANKMTSELELWLKIREKAINGRKTGCGILGYADMLAALGKSYGDPETTEKIFQIKLKAELDATTDMSIIRGAFPSFDINKEYDVESGDVYPKNKWYEFLWKNYSDEVIRFVNNGRRNITWSTIAPTGTVSILGGVSSGIEPLFMPFYIRRKRVLEGETADVVNENGSFKEYCVVHPKIKEWYKITKGEDYPVESGDNSIHEEIYKQSPYYNETANDIHFQTRVMTQSIIQKYICSSISSTVNLPESTTPETINEIYRLAYKSGLKGITIYRTGSRSGILVENKKQEESKPQFKFNHVPKLPKSIDADFYKVKYKGENYIIIAGLYQDFLVEIFAFKPTFDNIEETIPFSKIKEHRGIRTKVKSGLYNFQSDYIKIPDLSAYNSIEEKQYATNISLMLRHGIPLQFIINTTRKFETNISSLSSVIGRIIAKYNKTSETGEICPECGGKIINENGCKHCQSCSFSKCE